MKRWLVVPFVGFALGIAGCVGDTDPPSNVTNLSATLNAHGYTDDGPATWWWEYDAVKAELGTANDSEVCGNPPEADRRCGPAVGGAESSPVPLSVTVTGLTSNRTYYFRACGQDEGEGLTCGRTLSFKTLAGTSYAFERKWGSTGTGNGQFDDAWGVATDPTGNVYVADFQNHRIQKFTANGAFVTKWGTFGTADGQFAYPRDVATDSAGNVYVADDENHRVQKFTSTGAFIRKWGSQGSGDGQFRGLQSIDTDATGSVYVNDAIRVQKFTSTGMFIRKWGSFGSGEGQFDQSEGIAVDSSGNVYVADTFNHRIQKFTATGKFIRQWAHPYPRFVDTDSAGSVYVTNQGNEVMKYTPTGAPITQWSITGLGDGGIRNANGIATDLLGNVFVGDSWNNQIEKFRPTQ